MDRVLGFLEVAGCFLLWVTYLVVLRAVAHAKRPDSDAPQAVSKRRDENEVSGRAAKSAA